MVAEMPVLPLLIAVKTGMFPVPLAGKPIDGSLFVHLNTVPDGVPEKFIAVVLSLLHKDRSAGFNIFGDS